MKAINIAKTTIAAIFALVATTGYCSKSYSIELEDGDTVEPGDSLMFTIEDFPSTIKGYDVCDEFLPDGISVEWTGKKFKTPKSATPKVKKIDGEYEIVVSDKGADNPCALKVSYSKKKKMVSGSFKVYCSYETKKGKLKLKSCTAKFSGTIGEDGGITVTIKKVGTYEASLM